MRDCKGQPDHKAGRAKKAIQGRRDRRVRKVLPVPKVQTARSRKRVSFSSHMPQDSIDVAAKRASTRPVINRWGPPRNLRRELSRGCGWSAITFQQTQRLRCQRKEYYSHHVITKNIDGHDLLLIWVDPFVIVIALPTALAGIVWVLFASGTTNFSPSAYRRDHVHGHRRRQ